MKMVIIIIIFFSDFLPHFFSHYIIIIVINKKESEINPGLVSSHFFSIHFILAKIFLLQNSFKFFHIFVLLVEIFNFNDCIQIRMGRMWIAVFFVGFYIPFFHPWYSVFILCEFETFIVFFSHLNCFVFLYIWRKIPFFISFLMMVIKDPIVIRR